MSGLYVDFRFCEVYYELAALEEYLKTITSQLPVIQSHLREGFAQDGDEAEEQWYWDTTENILPRLLFNSFIVSLWSVFESAIEDIADYVQKQKGQIFRLDDFGNFSLDRANRYFSALGFAFADKQSSAWEELRMICLTRNIVAHANGRLDGTNEETWKKIEEWVRKNRIDALRDADGYICLKASFLKRSYERVKAVLEDLIERAKAEEEAKEQTSSQAC